jgi:hypothetical protein
MIPAVLFIVSVVALGQFALYYWRSVLAGVASQPISERVRDAVGAADFGTLMKLHDRTPSPRESDGELQTVQVYYTAMEALNRLVGARFPQLAAWTNREMATCRRYVAVMVDRRLAAYLQCAAETRSL